MDKRTLLFLFALTLTLFGVNHYFDLQRQESLQVWRSQQHAQLLTKKTALDAEISEHSVPLSAWPLVYLYADPKGDHFVASAVQVADSYVTLTTTSSLPDLAYAKKIDEPAPSQALRLDSHPETTGALAIYHPSEKTSTPLEIGSLPDFGLFYLQQIKFSSNPEEAYSTSIGKYIDGHFTDISSELYQINRDLDPATPTHKTNPSSSLVFWIKDHQFLPVAIYHEGEKRLQYLEEVKNLPMTLVESKPHNQQQSTAEEQFYLIETPYQQLLFSNYGGAIAEINLPFKSETHPKSVVRPIEFDRLMQENHPYNDHFPGHPYFTSSNDNTASLKQHFHGQLGGYYPLLRRDLIQSGNRKSIRISPEYYALNIISEYPELAKLVYKVTHFDQNSITFEASQPHRRITKTFKIPEGSEAAPYCFDLTIQIQGENRGLWITSGVPEVEWISGGLAPALKYRVTRKKAEVENIDLPQDALTVSSVYPDWIANSNGFLGMILDPLSKIDSGYRVQHVAGTIVPSRLVEIDSEYEQFKASAMPGYLTLLPLRSSSEQMTFRIFAGPFSDTILKQVDAIYTNPATGENPDYIASQSFHGWFAFISEPFAKFLFMLMKLFHYITGGSWAFSIILLTVALRIMLYPLNAWSNKSMIKMQQIAPEVAAIQEKYKKDPKKSQMEILNLYRERGVNPMSGCLPMLIQMPFLIGMFDLLKSTFELRGAVFIPGWIDDLAAPDVLFSWHQPLFFIGNQFHLLPILLGIVMLLQQRLFTTQSVDPSKMTEQQRQQKAMGTMMSVVFAIMFYNFPSGLNIYWLSSMLLGMLQQWWTMRRVSVTTVAPKRT